MTERASWTTPADIKALVMRRWESGHLLATAERSSMFPWQLRCSRPSSRDLSERYDDVRRWIRALDDSSKARTGSGYEIVWADIRHRQLGENRVPAGLVVSSLHDALGLIGKRREFARFEELAVLTRLRVPELSAWLERRPLALLEHAAHWESILMVVKWFQENPRPGIYLRQVDLAGIDTKFIEQHRGLVAELLDAALPAGAVSFDMPTRQFDHRYGLKPKPALVRFRILDEQLALNGLTDIATPAADFARLDLPVKRVFITENEINGLCFPQMPESLVIFGLGFGHLRLSECTWLLGKEALYWGDIDTHGFAILDRLRAVLPHVKSILMDEETLMYHCAHVVQEPLQHEGDLLRLTEDEHKLFSALTTDRFGAKPRLEQERIAYGWVQRCLANL